MNLRTVLTISALLIAVPAAGHDAAKGPNGGRVVEAGDYHVELVAKQNVVEVFLTDAKEKAVQPMGFKGVAILLIDGKSARIPLEPTEGTRLSGKSGSALPAEPKGAVQITAPNGKSVQARFK